MEFTAPFGAWLKQSRTKMGVTRSELARRAGYSVETLHKIEGGKLKASQLMAERLVEALDVPEMQRADFIAFATGESPHHKPHNLPAPATALIGREHELKVIQKWMRSGDVRLVTFIGPPGVGKTRLALEAAWELRDHYSDGAWMVALAAVSDPGMVETTIANALGVSNSVGARSIEDVKRHLRDKHLLLLLDNYEQVQAAGPVISELLAAASGLHVLVTSRLALNLRGEHLFAVSPLDEQPAVALFTQRAQAVRPDFSLNDNAGVVAEICNRLDRLPLAIELAASRARLFDPPQLLERLDSRLKLLTSNARDVPSRHRTLRDAIAVSYSLLADDERVVFRRLGAFAGGFTLTAAEQVAGEGLKTPMIDVLQSLVDQSLLKIDQGSREPRFSMLQTILEFSREALRDSGEADVIARRHAEFVICLSEREGGRRKDYTTPFMPEIANLDRAADTAQRLGDDVLQMRLFAIPPRWCIDAYRCLDTKWLIEWTQRPDPTQDELISLWGCALLRVSILMEIRDVGHDIRRRTIERSVAVLTQAGDIDHLADALAELSKCDWVAGDYTQAAVHAERSLGLRTQMGDLQPIVNAQAWLAAVWRDTGEHDQAEAMFNQCIALCRELADANIEAMAENGLGDLEYDRGDLVKSRRHYDAALNLWCKHSSYIWARVLPQRGLGRIACVEGDLTQAEKCLRQVVQVAEQGNAGERSFCLQYYAWLKHLQGDDESARRFLRQAIESQQLAVSRLNLVESLERAAWLAADQQKSERAARLFGAAHALRQKMGAPQPAGDHAFHERALSITKAELGESAFNAAWAEGSSMSLESAAEFALMI